MPIEIGPDGSPIITSTVGGNTPEKRDSFVTPTEESSGIVPTPTIKSEPTGMDKRIEDSRKFNESLKREATRKSTPVFPPIFPPEEVIEIDENGKVSIPSLSQKLEGIKLVLKNNGMDSQQQERAIQQISEILNPPPARPDRILESDKPAIPRGR